eukprot:scaffold53196_cov28-Tisochrysis_lutea.AAC.2
MHPPRWHRCAAPARPIGAHGSAATPPLRRGVCSPAMTVARGVGAAKRRERAPRRRTCQLKGLTAIQIFPVYVYTWSRSKRWRRLASSAGSCR